ncbi:MAG: hypothetical protein RW306_18050 [Geobacteraceae bacterium]|nr:hypothetical protein [Geobacteraceae bacterium]
MLKGPLVLRFYVFIKPSGEQFNAANFCNNTWIKAFKKAGTPYMVPYCMRHSVAAWSLTLRIDMLRLVALTEHRDKKMVFVVCGNYVEGLEQDVVEILDYFGKDFIAPEVKQPTIISMQQDLLPHLAWQMQQTPPFQ